MKTDGVVRETSGNGVGGGGGSGDVESSMWDANSIVKADTDDTPIALVMGASTILARLAAGGIVAATPTEIRTLIDVYTIAQADSAIGTAIANLAGTAPALLNTLGEISDALADDPNFAATMTTALATKADDAATTSALAGKVDKSTFDANSLLIADADNTPIVLPMGASTIVARLAAGGIVAATPTELRTLLSVYTIAQVDAAIAAVPTLSNPTVARSHPDPAAVTGVVAEPTANIGNAFRIHGRALAQAKIAIHVGTASGNVSVGVYEGTAGRSDPGAQLATSGAVACPASGYAEIALGGAVDMTSLRWLALSVDNTTATFGRISGGVTDTPLRKGFSARKTTNHPLPDPFGVPTSYDSIGFVMVGQP